MTIDLKYEQSSIRPRATLLLGNEQSRTMQAPRLEGENGQPSTGEYIQAAPRERAAGDLEIRAGASTEGGAVGYSCAGGKVASSVVQEPKAEEEEPEAEEEEPKEGSEELGEQPEVEEEEP
ncbi:MAG: hypothetical protein LQ344_005726 [Seirophora lacunosa]|nr:MAG: hypothetical protein LQ344_005726 [Seirophora lacunosa]